ncbi:MAG: lysophospholipid acyltransferase family protein [Candidatus Rokuibacteriota bacterium]
MAVWEGATTVVWRAWRALRTGLAFVAFGVGALTLTLAVFPLVRFIPGHRQQREFRMQYLVHLSFRCFETLMKCLGLIRVTRAGTEQLRGSGARLVIANHPTLIDVVLLIAGMPQADCVVKQKHWRNWTTRGVMAAAGYIPNDDGQALVQACVDRLAAGRSLLLFPEGTRSPRSGLGHFQRGVAHIALRSGCDPIPVLIQCDPPTLMKGTRWYDVPNRTAELRIEVGAPIPIAALAGDATGEPAAARRLTRGLVSFYEDRLLAGRVARAGT